MRIWRCLLVLAVVASGVLAAPSDSSSLAAAERLLLTKVNAARGRAGLPALDWDGHLHRAAERHAATMAAARQLSHQLPGEPPMSARIVAAGETAAVRLAENVAVGPDVAIVHAALMASPPHRANILSPRLDAIGIGIVARTGELWVTEDFAQHPPSASAAGMATWIERQMARARRGHRLSPLRRRAAPALRRLVCDLGRRDSTDAGAVLAALPRATAATVFNTFGVEPLPPGLLRHLSDAGSFSLAVCLARNARYPGGSYWAAVALYPQRIGP